MSEIKVNKISPRTACGTTTLGDSGDSFTIPAGVTITNNGTQTGFGRTGTVDWQTTIQTSTPFTAVSGKGYFINTTSGAITMNLPSSPSVGDIVSFKDYARTFQTNKLTVGRGGSNMDGGAADTTFDTEGLSATLIYMDATKGWSLITDDATTKTGAGFVAATGGTITTVCTDYKVHTFTGPGTFEVTNAGNSAGSNEISYLVVAGGGGAGYYYGAAGAGGGFREGKTPQCSYTSSPIACTSGSNNGLPVAVASYPVTVGAGGPSKTSSACASPGTAPSGSNSVFAGTTTITSAGGGGGSGGNGGAANGGNGGSGGGAGGASGATGGSGNTPPVSPSQGNNGESNPGGNRGAAGGGAGEAGGTDGTNAGGDGATTSINGTPTTYAGGGGGSSPGQAGGDGGGGLGGGTIPQTNGGANTGGGQGGCANGGAGGSGIVIIRYKFQ